MNKTDINWADYSWSPITGCTKKSEGCRFCYVERDARRYQRMKQPKFSEGFNLTLHEHCLDEPLTEFKGGRVFVCPMSDVFHERVPSEFRDRIMEVTRKAPWHTYLLLTKRPERMAEYFQTRKVPLNVWLGTTVEAAEYKYRIDILRSIKGSFKFLSCEPLLGDLGELDLTGIDWVIVGGESGGKARPMKEEWVLNIKKQADAQEVAFFFKQWGTWGNDGVKRSKKANGKLLQGKICQEYPQK